MPSTLIRVNCRAAYASERREHILRGAVASSFTGPGGIPWGYPVRLPRAKENTSSGHGQDEYGREGQTRDQSSTQGRTSGVRRGGGVGSEGGVPQRREFETGTWT